MNTKVIGGVKPDPDAINQMARGAKLYPSARWAAYQNHDIGHPELGHLKFLAVGPENTYQVAPARLPDTPDAINWRYVHVGFVNLETGDIREA